LSENKDKRSPLMQQNKRKVNFKSANVKFRAVTEEVNGQQIRMLKGYPILFDVYGHPYVGSKWVEKIDKNALATVDFSNLVLLWNHDPSLVLAKAGKNMEVSIDDIGLFVSITLGSTWLDNYVYDRVQRELVDGMSFWFDNQAMVATDWDNKIDVITKINEIYEVSIVTFPAYQETVVITTDGTDPNPSPSSEDTIPADPTPEDVQENIDEGVDMEATKQALINLVNQL
jgi:HK97 family phage prohead protease